MNGETYKNHLKHFSNDLKPNLAQIWLFPGEKGTFTAFVHNSRMSSPILINILQEQLHKIREGPGRSN
jgi:hypothetical protein